MEFRRERFIKFYLVTMIAVFQVCSNEDLWVKLKWLHFTTKYFKYLYRQNADESDQKYLERLFKRSANDSDYSYLAKMEIIMKACSEISYVRMNVTHLCITKEYYDIKYRRIEGEEYGDYCERVVMQKADETDAEYIGKMELMKELYPDMTLWNDIKGLKYTLKYHLYFYKQYEYESEPQYFMRLTNQWYKEDNDHYKKRMRIVHKVYPKLSLWLEEEWLPLTVKYYKYYYDIEEYEDEQHWFKRILTRECDENVKNYCKRMDMLQKVFYHEISTAAIFDSEEHLDITKEYFTHKYGKKEGETDNDFLYRTFNHYAHENDKEYGNRLIITMRCFPHLEFWTDPARFNTTRHFYKIYYAKESVTSEDEYYTKVFTKRDEETDEEYKAKIEMFRMTCPTDKVWNSVVHLDYTKKYFRLMYARGPDESESAWAVRLLAYEPSEDDDDMCEIKMTILKLVLGEEQFNKLQCIAPAEGEHSLCTIAE